MPHTALFLLSFVPCEQRYILTHGSLRLDREITEEQARWEEWLREITSFAFEDRQGRHCTVRKEYLQRGGTYWYAYRSIAGHTRKRYLGKTSELTLAHLEEVSASFLSSGKKPVSRKLARTDLTAQHTQYFEGRTATLPLLETRLHPPRLPERLVARTHLYARLDSCLTHRLTLLLAPAGFGKTTLVNQWLTSDHASAFPAVSWVSLEASDSDPLRFWRYILLACQKLLAPEQQKAGQAALEMLSAVLNPPFIDAPPLEATLTLLLNALAQPSCGGLLVLDDYHAIGEPGIHELFGFFIDHLPTSVHVLLLSRAEPALPLSRWRARGEVSELYTGDLRFSRDETALFLEQTLAITPSETALAGLEHSLEGWVAGLRLLSLSLTRWHMPQSIEQALRTPVEHIHTPGLHTRGSDTLHRPLFDYFVTEILKMQPEPVQHFLLYTSVLGRLCAPLCDAVLTREESAGWLESVARAGLFLEALEGAGGWYRYHALFAEAMRNEARGRLGEEALREGLSRASLWYEQESMLVEAIEHAWLAQDMERMARLLEQIDILNPYEPQTLRRWLEQLPEEVLREHPMLCHIFAVELRFPVELRFSIVPVTELPRLSAATSLRVEALLQMAEEGWRKQGRLAWIGANYSFRALSTLVDQGPFIELVSYARQALTFLPLQGPLDYRLQLYRASCLLFVGIETLYRGQVSEAQKMFLQAQEDNASPSNSYMALDLELQLGKCHLLQGKLKQAQHYLRQAFTQAGKLGDAEVAADALLELAWIAFEQNDLADTERMVHEADELAQRLSPPRPELFERVALQSALLRYARGELAAALAELPPLPDTQRSTGTSNSFWLLSRLHTWQGRLEIATGHIREAEERLEHCTRARTHTHAPVHTHIHTHTHAPVHTHIQRNEREIQSVTDYLAEEILRGRIWLAQGKSEAALQQFTRLLSLAQENLHHYHALEIEVLLALTYATQQQEQQAHYRLRQVLAQTLHEHYIRLFLNEGQPLLALLLSLLKDLPYSTPLRLYVQSILRAARHTAASKHLQSPKKKDHLLFEPLSSQEQRILRLLVEGRSNQEIANELVVSVNTIKYHTKHLYQKLGVSNRLQASAAARVLSLDREK